MKKRLKISIETIREIYEESFDDYIACLREAGIPIDGKKFSRDREWSHTSSLGGELVTTTYKIIETSENTLTH